MTIKKALLRGLIGIPIGVFISQLIVLLISLGWGNGEYIAAVPSFVQVVGGELTAVGLQFLFSCVVGFAFAAGSCVFEVEQWGITKQTVLHLIILCGAFFPIALFLRWVSPTFASVISYFVIWISIYAIVWVLQFFIWRGKTRRLNQKLKKG